MATITLKNNPINTVGQLPAVGTKAADFELVKTDLSTASLKDFEGKNIVLNIFPSIDTPTCSASVRHFNQDASKLNNTVVLCISRDLPFAQARFCGAEGIENVVMLSDFRTGDFGKNYGLTIVDGPLKDLHSRCIVVLNNDHQVIYEEQVSEIANEPNYTKVFEALK
ncbi:thiol peroxidase [Flavobacterium sp. NKUCC04_CG]|uniref:thiol peroxidase n=1 Tax=Flavobacterium sp. NKUCC04_CG TaxID=2842121 RepID=UPI001C5BB064|nr:thiol peroxidase [Flavobacterium sp. NKUCC04_CG]MBW3518644.1 thiol peroxidase [Flavobacterium sp. NKUCC04_CG]